MEMVLLVAIAVVGRLMPHPANMTPMGALSVFAGSRFGVKKGVAVTVAAMLVSDLVVGLHPVMWATYGALFLSVALGRYGVRRVHVPAVVGAVLSSSVVFFLITNFAVWALPGSMYPKTVAGLSDSYVMALPFFRNSLIGDLSYAAVFFGGWVLATQNSRFFRLHSAEKRVRDGRNRTAVTDS